jgi:hypothetical protein
MNSGIDGEIDAGKVSGELSDHRLLQEVAVDIGVAMRRLDPYDRRMREQLGDVLFEKHQAGFPLGSVERARFLLKIIHNSFPTVRLSTGYFDNLEVLLGNRCALDCKGQVILGLGTGRCGSTSLSAAFRNVATALSTHENPPMIFWQPQREQMEFHMKRLALLCRYYPVVFDAAHWWLNAIDAFFESFPQGKVVGLHRGMESCVTSFLGLKGVEPGTPNHWALPNNGIWGPNIWDPCYPSYAVPQGLESDLYRAKGTQIQWYVDSYNRQLYELARARPDQVMLISTESLDQPQVAKRLAEFTGVQISIPARRYNAVALESEAQQHSWWF